MRKEDIIRSVRQEIKQKALANPGLFQDVIDYRKTVRRIDGTSKKIRHTLNLEEHLSAIEARYTHVEEGKVEFTQEFMAMFILTMGHDLMVVDRALSKAKKNLGSLYIA